MSIALPILLQQIGQISWFLILMVVINYAFHKAKIQIPDMDLMDFIYQAVLTYGYMLLLGLVLYIIASVLYLILGILGVFLKKGRDEIDSFRTITGTGYRNFSVIFTMSFIVGALIVFWTYDPIFVLEYGKWGVVLLLILGIVKLAKGDVHHTLILEGQGYECRYASYFSYSHRELSISGETRGKTIQWLISFGWKIQDTNYEIVDGTIKRWLITFVRD